MNGVERSAATLVNVCGASYSGTTMLDLMLGNAEDAFSCGEVSARFRPWRAHHRRLNVRFVIDSSKDLCWLIDATAWARRAGMPVINVLI